MTDQKKQPEAPKQPRARGRAVALVLSIAVAQNAAKGPPLRWPGVDRIRLLRHI